MKDDLIIGSRIRTIRESMSLTREQFSELIDISSSFLSQIESCNSIQMSCVL